MTKHSTRVCDDLEEDVTRYAYEDKLSPQERSRVEEHLKACPSCSELVFFIQKTRAFASKRPIRFEPASEPCVDAATITAFADDKLDPETARKLGVHLLHCKRCQDAYLFLRSLNEEQFEEKVLARFDAPLWTDVVIRAVLKAGQKVTEAAQKVVQKGLEVISISGSGHIFQPELVPTLGEYDESSPSVTIEDTVKDEETNSTASVNVNVGVDQKNATATLQLTSHPPQKDWTVSLATLDGDELMRAPLVAEETILGSDLADPCYMVTIHKGEKALACFTLELRPA